MSEQHITEVYGLFAQWCGERGIKDLHAMPGLWRGKIGRFDIAINGHNHEVEGIPPYEMKVEANGFPLGLVGPFDGILMHGAEDDLIADLKAEIAAEAP